MNDQNPNDASPFHLPELNTNQFYLANDATEIDVFPIAGGVVAVGSRRHPFKETPNEDAAVLIPVDDERGVLAIADGCGGMTGGEQAARLAVKSLALSVTQSNPTALPSSSLRAAILDGIEIANKKVLEIGTGAATTLAVVEIDNDSIRPFHVGDSSVLLTGSRGKLKLLTVSHSPVGYAVHAGVIDEQDAIHHEDRHLVSNVLGTSDTHIEIGASRKMAARDTLLIASDGVFDNLHTDEIVQLIRKGTIQNAAEEIMRVCTERMNAPEQGAPSKPDDLTLILFRRGRPRSAK